LKGVDSEGWKRIIEQSKERRSVHIDTAVTTDIHRLIRLTDSLHGKTGFKKTIVPLTGIESFDPLKEALAFKKGTLTLLVTDVPNFRIGNSSYGPFKNERVELPTAVALYLLCREAAKVPY
jgi:DNA primase small subunit